MSERSNVSESNEECDDSNQHDNHSKRSRCSNRSSSANSREITVEAISTTKNSIVIPSHHIIIDKRVLSSIVNDYHKLSELLRKVFSPKVIDELIRGVDVTAEEFDSVTILFSDIVGLPYTKISFI